MKNIIFFCDALQFNIMFSRAADDSFDIEHFNLLEFEGYSLFEKQYAENKLDNVDYFIAYDNNQLEKAVTLGIEKSKIINFSIFDKTAYHHPIEKFDKSCDYDCLLMGMSHSQCAINVEEFSRNIFKMSAPSMDMFLHLNYFKKLCTENPDAVKNFETIFIEIPYYIFNYDLSRFGNFVYTKLKYFDIIGNYNNFDSYKDSEESKQKFKAFIEIFKEPLPQNDMVKINPIKRVLKSFYKAYKIMRMREKVWENIYEDTIKQNQEYWETLLNCISINCPKAKVKVVVMPFNPIFRLSHKKQIKNMKKIFYNSVKKVEVFDDFDLYNSSTYFDDHCHLNKKGGLEYSNKFKDYLKIKFMFGK